ncbi:T9SS type A sorting domain-containing protein [Paraflavitalea pollutisoli]|uniref:T9SS type A sorting domain-containing protein n=1 Tax=Paraflavitalea pollutisoli TaxID=3034143 RepID=UPI0023ECA6CD|nr:T9SS type A sorting domain-containing protein [Paraflavitalea sp. H1-2-19X]
MKRILSACTLLCLLQPVVAQQIVIGNGGQVTLHAGNSFTGNGLTLRPTAALTLTGATLDRSSAVTHPFANPYVTRVFTFTTSPPVFTGDIAFEYAESELNGLSEAGLSLLVYNGSSWQNAGVSTPDPVVNTVISTGITNLALGELILAGSLALPLTWGAVTAQRQHQEVVITWHTEQEQQVSHFDVERSNDGQSWTTAIARVPATNQATPQVYLRADHPQHTGWLHYRIRQTDLDGRYTLSPSVQVAPDNTEVALQVQPNPASSWFSIAGTLPEKVSSVAMYNSSGAILKTWKGFQTRFALPAAAPGSYYIRIVLISGITETRKLLVK